jgi:isopentenyl-diphosphate Delta-isomerase
MRSSSNYESGRPGLFMSKRDPVSHHIGETRARKDDHLRINLAGEVTGEVSAGFEKYRFEHLALPEIDLSDVSLSTSLFGRHMRAPILVSCMTGGTREAAQLNAILAETAQHYGLAMGLGSGRVLLEDPQAPGMDVRGRAPDIPLLANLGAGQLSKGTGVDACRRLLDLTGADAMVLHLNPLQEALQPEGEPRFRGLLREIERLCLSLEAPVVVKEVGSGLAPDVVAALFAAGVAAVDVAGAGGTSWSEVERHRLTGTHKRIALAFRSWGIPTTQAVSAARAVPATALCSPAEEYARAWTSRSRLVLAPTLSVSPGPSCAPPRPALRRLPTSPRSWPECCEWSCSASARETWHPSEPCHDSSTCKAS